MAQKDLERDDEDLDFDSMEEEDKSGDKMKVLIAIISALLLLVVGVIIFLLFFKSENKAIPEDFLSTPKPSTSIDDIMSGKDEEEEELPMDIVVTSKATEDFTGGYFTTLKSAVKVDVETDFVKYTRMEKPLGEGAYEFWVQVEYNNLIFDLQVSYTVYHGLKNTGITVAEIEYVPAPTGSGKLISYMILREDLSDILKKGE